MEIAIRPQSIHQGNHQCLSPVVDTNFSLRWIVP